MPQTGETLIYNKVAKLMASCHALPPVVFLSDATAVAGGTEKIHEFGKLGWQYGEFVVKNY